MSGKQAKAKRKSAKKTAAEMSQLSAEPPFAGARLDEFVIGGVRCFAEEQRVPIRPITLLLGENSTGKTAFLGGYRMAHHLTFSADDGFNRPPVRTFNDPPFAMGAFRDILNRRPGAASPPDFQLGGQLAYRAVTSGGLIAWGGLQVIYSFKESGSDAAPYKASFVFANGEQLDVFAEPDKISGVRLHAADPGTGKKAQAGLPSRSIALSDIAMFLTRATREEMRGEGKTGAAKNVAGFLKRQICPDRRDITLLQFLNFPVEYSLAPIRSRPKRTYDPVSDEYSPEGDHVPMFLAQLSRTNREEWEVLRRRLVAFGKASGMFSDFKVKGLGKHVGDPFQIHVKAAGVMSNLIDVGYGVGQVYPLLVQIMRATQRKMRSLFLLQEPEVHLHPQAQAALTSFFVQSAKEDGHAFVIETHGDNIIDRVRICVSNGLIPPEDVVILYFEQQAAGNVKIHPLRLDEMANLRGFPSGYRDFFMEEGDRLLGFKKLPKERSHVRRR